MQKPSEKSLEAMQLALEPSILDKENMDMLMQIYGPVTRWG